MFCTACNTEIQNATHYTIKLHSANIKRKLNNIPPLTALEETVEEVVPEPEVHKHYSVKRTICFDNKCFFCDYKGDLLDHINSEHVKVDSDHLEICIDDYITLTCFYCKKVFSNEDKLREHLLSYFRTKKVVRSETQIRRPYDVKEGQIMKVDVKKDKKVRNKVAMNDIKVSLAMNHQKHFVAHWLQ